jgi:hypothetical protein
MSGPSTSRTISSDSPLRRAQGVQRREELPQPETVAFLESICRGPGLELQAYYLRLTPATIQVAGINFRQVTLFPEEKAN